jgi:hypothetical protein
VLLLALMLALQPLRPLLALLALLLALLLAVARQHPRRRMRLLRRCTDDRHVARSCKSAGEAAARSRRRSARDRLVC